MLLVPEVKGACMTPDGADPTERHRPQCWIESRAREREPGHSLQQCSPAGESGFHVGVSCWGSGEACPRLRADLTGWGVKPHTPGIESGWGEVSIILCLIQRASGVTLTELCPRGLVQPAEAGQGAAVLCPL